MLFVWYHCDGVDPMWDVPEQKEITSKEWVYHGQTEHFVNVHIQVGDFCCVWSMAVGIAGLDALKSYLLNADEDTDSANS